MSESQVQTSIRISISARIKMASDREVLRIIWEGQIPVCFQADPDEIDGVRQPENFYLLVSRLSYLPLVTEKVGAYTVIFAVGAFLMTFFDLFAFAGEKTFLQIRDQHRPGWRNLVRLQWNTAEMALSHW